MKEQGKFAGLDWEIHTSKGNYNSINTVGVSLKRGTMLFRNGVSMRVSADSLRNTENVERLKFLVLEWFIRRFRDIKTYPLICRLFIRTFGKRYEDSYSLWNKVYIK